MRAQCFCEEGRGQMSDDRPRRVTITEVAQRARVSTATVSHVLNGKGRVHPVLSERVQAVARELDYQPHILAQSLRTGRTRTLGLCVSSFISPTVAAIVEGASQAARAAGYTLLISTTERDPELEQADLAAMARQRVAAVMAISASDDPAPYRQLQLAGVPIVFQGHRPPGVAGDLILSDQHSATRAATAHLLGGGRRRIALLLTSRSMEVYRRRLAGYAEAHAAAGVSPQPDFVRAELHTETQARAAVRELLSSSEPPDALVAGGDSLVQGALEELRHQGIAIPSRLAFVGAGDLRWACLLDPPLSMIEVDGHETGRQLIRLALERLDPSLSLSPSRDVVLPSRFVARASSP